MRASVRLADKITIVQEIARRTAAAEIGTPTQMVRSAQEAGEMLQRLIPDIRRTAELVTEISAARRDQDGGADQINHRGRGNGVAPNMTSGGVDHQDAEFERL